MSDKRAFAQFDVGYLDNPKISDVFDTSPIAICMHFASVLYCAQHLTDGYIALRAMQRKAGGTNEDSRLLIDAGLWHEPGHDCDGCPEVPSGKLYVHDYLQHNRTSEGVKGRSSAAKIGAEARWAKEREARKLADANRIATEDETQCLEREKEREKETSLPQASPARPARRKSSAPEHMPVTDSMRAWAKENDVFVNLENETAKFLDHHASKGTTFVDWNRAWQTWMRKGKQWAKAPEPDRPSTGAGSVVPIGYAWANR